MKVSNDVLAVLSNLSVDGQLVRLTDKLDRKLYLDVNKVLEALGGKWERRRQAHVFDGDPQERIEQVIALGEVTTAKDLGFFATPREIADQLIERADVRPSHVVLEPSAGEGAIVQGLLDVECEVWAIERDDRRRQKLIESTRADQSVAIVVPPTVGADDFMEYDAIEPFDRVVMNPPFCRVGKGDHLDHVRHAFGMLKPGGVLVTVLPAGVRFRRDRRYREFREWYEAIGGELDDLPPLAFQASGTNVRTCVLRIRKI